MNRLRNISGGSSKEGTVRLLDHPKTQFKINQLVYVRYRVPHGPRWLFGYSDTYHGPFRISQTAWNAKTQHEHYTVTFDEGPDSPEWLTPGGKEEPWIDEVYLFSLDQMEKMEREGVKIVRRQEHSEDWVAANGPTSETDLAGHKRAEKAKKELLIMDKLNGAGIYP